MLSRLTFHKAYVYRDRYAAGITAFLVVVWVTLIFKTIFWPKDVAKPPGSLEISLATQMNHDVDKLKKNEEPKLKEKKIDKEKNISPIPSPVPSANEASSNSKNQQPLSEKNMTTSNFGEVDKSYEAHIKSVIEARKVYPTSRQAILERPIGIVFICLTLNRNGKLIDSRVRDSSGSIILDTASKRLVTSVDYPPIPNDAFIGVQQREFCVRLKYEMPN